MRQYNIVFEILLILSIVDFILAVPVLVQEKRQAHVNVVPIPKDVISVFEKRVEEGLDKVEKLAEEYFKTSEKPVESSHATASSITTPPGPEHGPTNDVKAPASNPASPADPDLLMEPLSPWPISYAMPAVQEGASSESGYRWLTGTSVPQMNPNKRPGTDFVAPPPPKRPTHPWYGEVTALWPNSGWPKVHDFEAYRQPTIYPAKKQAPGSSAPRLPTEPGYTPVATPWPNSGWPKVLDFEAYPQATIYSAKAKASGPANPRLPTQPGSGEATARPPSSRLPKGPIMLNFGGDRNAAANLAKGKAKESRHHIPGTARDGGDAAQREV